MKKLIKGRTLGRKPAHRKALMRNLASALIKYGKIETTTAKAKELRPYIEKMITRAKTDNVNNRRIIDKDIKQKSVLKKLFTEIGPKYAGRNGGYTRILKKGLRQSDSASISYIELV
ncbi:MAG TPA: 50S ribosomal protein L17 [bacterium]|nr:50S ribosomal protein L17 [bacterium]HPN30694.1 50S ribosomal protein L17 [bacterium]